MGEIKLLFHIAIDRAPQFERLVQRKSAALLMSEDTEEEEEEVGADVDTVKVTLYKGFTLDCPVIGEPEPNVSWYKVGLIESVLLFAAKNPYYFV